MESDAADIQKMIAAYRTLDLEPNASAGAIRYQYRELALLHHPDRHKPGSPEQASAAMRMAEIDAAYGLIRNAPLKDYQGRATTSVDDLEPPPNPEIWFERRVGLGVETIGRMALGAAVGVFLALRLDSRGVPGSWLYLWLMPLTLAFGFTTSLGPLLLRVLRWRT